MKEKIFRQTAGAIFALAGLLHLLRVVLGWRLEVNGWFVPVWLSVLAVVIVWYLAGQAFKKR